MGITPKEKLVQQFTENRPCGEITAEDVEDVEAELDLMVLEGIDLAQVTLREVLRRLGLL